MTNFFINTYEINDLKKLRQARLLVNVSLFTAIFSFSYLLLSLFTGFEAGIVLMSFNVLLFLLVPFLVKYQVPIYLTGNIYILGGAIAVVGVIYFSGGFESPIFPWLIAFPTMALLIVNRKSAYLWMLIALFFNVYFAIIFHQGIILPQLFDNEWYVFFAAYCAIGLLLLLFVINLAFDSSRNSAIQNLEDNNKELKKAQQSLQEKNKLLQVQKSEITTQSEDLKILNTEKDYVIEILSHDLKSPLNSILGLAELMQKETLSKDQLEYVALIEQSALKVKSLIDRVLVISEMDAGSLKMSFEEVRMNKVLENVINASQIAANMKHIQLELDANTDAVISCDPTYLHQVFENLISNAIKFSPKGSKVHITPFSKQDKVRIEVIDQGPGVKKEEMELLFKKFKRLSAQPTGGEQSTGLGLSLVLRYVESMHGKIWCESVEGEGANFIVEFPLIEK